MIFTCIPRNIGAKEKIDNFNFIKNHSYLKRHHQENEKTSQRMGENIFKSHIG
jgi:hypothetical protein